MALITTYQHFGYAPVKIPNAGPIAANNPEATSVAAFIAKYEPQYLKYIFGQAMYDLFIAGLFAETAAYVAIRDGGTYTDPEGILQKWEGFTEGKNPIANYIYWHILDESRATLMGTGVRKATAENATEAMPDYKMVTAWNEMVKFNFKLHEYLYANRATFPTYIGLTYSVYRYDPRHIRDNQSLFIAQNTDGI